MIRLILAHRDFVPWNTRLSPAGSLFVFDWEFSQPGWLPLGDLFHFYVFPVILNRNSHALLWQRYRNEWTAHAARLGVDEELVLPLYVAYLADTMLFYLEARVKVPEVGDDRVAGRLEHELVQVFPLLNGGAGA